MRYMDVERMLFARLQSDQVELKYIRVVKQRGAVNASIGPGGIEIFAGTGPSTSWAGLQSDQVELKSLAILFAGLLAGASIGPGGIEMAVELDLFVARNGASIGPGGIEMISARLETRLDQQLQSDQVELKCRLAACPPRTARASIGPGGIEIRGSNEYKCELIWLQSA